MFVACENGTRTWTKLWTTATLHAWFQAAKKLSLRLLTRRFLLSKLLCQIVADLICCMLKRERVLQDA